MGSRKKKYQKNSKTQLNGYGHIIRKRDNAIVKKIINPQKLRKGEETDQRKVVST